MTTSSKPKKSLQYSMRAIHRVLGYLTVGLVIVYALSGIILIHRTGNFMKRGTEISTTLQPGLTGDQVASELNIRHFKVTEETDRTITFSQGTYDKTTGAANYVKKEFIPPFDKMADLHKLPDAKNRHIAAVTTLFGVVLFLLALTSLFMYKPKSKQYGANMLYTVIGIAIAVVLLICV